jgi:hypothetical protein
LLKLMLISKFRGEYSKVVQDQRRMHYSKDDIDAAVKQDTMLVHAKKVRNIL